MNTRVREIRKSPNHSNHTLEKFGESIGLKKSALSLIENGINTLTEQNIKVICREYNVNETWLRTGEGEMFVDLTSEEELAKLTKKYLCGSNEEREMGERLTSALLKLSVEQWRFLTIVAETMVKEKNAKKEE